MNNKKIVLSINLLVTLGPITVNSYASYKQPYNLKVAVAPVVMVTVTQPSADTHAEHSSPNTELATNEKDYLSFKVDLALREQFIRQFIERIQQQNPVGAEKLALLQTKGDIIESIQTTIQPYGLTVTHLADAYALWWVSMWQAAQGKTYALERKTAQAVKEQATKALFNTGVFKDANDSTKQELAETLLLQSLLLDAALEQVKPDPLLLQQLSESVLNEAKQSGLELDKMLLTPKGFVPLER